MGRPSASEQSRAREPYTTSMSPNIIARARYLLRRYGRIFTAVLLLSALVLCSNPSTAVRFWLWSRRTHLADTTVHEFDKAYMDDISANSFTNFKYHGAKCNISSRDIYQRSGPLCQDRQSLLYAMSSGGRIGKDAPYIARGCDYKWFSTQEICDILDRFSQVVLIGDSMLRHVIGAINILIREDLGYGGVTDWNFDAREREQCFCNRQFDVHHCSVQGIFSTEDVARNDPSSLRCPQIRPGWTGNIRIEQMVRYPMPEVELARLRSALDVPKVRPRAFILGHGLWNNLNHKESLAWLDTVLGIIGTSLEPGERGRRGNQGRLPILLMTPNAAGERKPDQWLISQGNKALVNFERRMAVETAKRRIDHLGTWNMSIQASLYDGVHMDMRGNIVKAMMVMNWLDAL